MADININPFGDHDKTESELTGENIPLTPVGRSIWKPEHEQETSFGGEENKELNSRKFMLKGCIKSHLKSRIKPQNHFILMISTSEMGDCATLARTNP